MPEKRPLGHPRWQAVQAPSPRQVTLNTEPCSISFSTCPSTSCPPEALCHHTSVSPLDTNGPQAHLYRDIWGQHPPRTYQTPKPSHTASDT